MELSKHQIGQMIMIGLEGDELTAGERGLLRGFPVGGFILFSHNLKGPEQIFSLCRSLWDTADKLHPFIAIDQEGGRVHRLPPPFTHFPSAAALGRTASADLAYRAGLAMAREINAAGINLNFAPVLDVNSNPSNPVIGDRALSADPDEVGRLGWELVRGLRAGGVIPCVKHFPGHGDTAQDSHLELPVVEKTVDELNSVELPPFVHACRNRVETLMTAHVVYPALDAKHPATLSRRIVRGLLREKLQYDGVVFSDDLEMKAISENYSVEDAVRLAILAGIDVLLFGHETERAVAAFDFLCREVTRNEELRGRVAQSYGRIRLLKSRALAAFAGEEKLASCIGQSETIVAEIHGSRGNS
jgi:beta-N-acetylhexosaminidase